MTDERSWWDYEQSVRENVRDEAARLMGEAYPEDEIQEMADGWVPIYTSEILRLAADNIDLAIMEPDLGPAFDGTPTPVNVIAANMYETLTQVAYDEWEDVKSDAWYCQETSEWAFDSECGHEDCDGSE